MNEREAYEQQMFERSFDRPKNYFKLSAAQQWVIDRELGILDWKGTGLSDEDIQRFRNYFNEK